MKIAKERKSAVLASNAVHHRIDSLTSIVALLTIGGAHFLTEAAWLDPVGGLIISVMVIKAGWANTLASLLELADTSVDNEIKKELRRATSKALIGEPLKGLDGVEGGHMVEIREIQGVKSGQNYLVDVALAVPGNWSVETTRSIEDAVRERAVSRVRGVRRVKVRFLASDQSYSGFSDEFIGANIDSQSTPEPEEVHAHEHEQHREKDHSHAHRASSEVAKDAGKPR